MVWETTILVFENESLMIGTLAVALFVATVMAGVFIRRTANNLRMAPEQLKRVTRHSTGERKRRSHTKNVQ